MTSCRKLNTSPASLEDPATMKKFLCQPPVKRMDLHFPLGLEVTARNLKGVTIKDALDAIYKQFKKKVLSSFPSSVCPLLSMARACIRPSPFTYASVPWYERSSTGPHSVTVVLGVLQAVAEASLGFVMPSCLDSLQFPISFLLSSPS